MSTIVNPIATAAMPQNVTAPVAPTGFHLLIEMRKLAEKTAGGIVLPEKSRKIEETAGIIGRVLGMGPDAYSDPQRFPSGPWCKVGDFILMRAYSGSRLISGDTEYRIINDDTVEAVVSDPSKVERP